LEYLALPINLPLRICFDGFLGEILVSTMPLLSGISAFYPGSPVVGAPDVIGYSSVLMAYLTIVLNFILFN
jgi:hypothetical protein